MTDPERAKLLADIRQLRADVAREGRARYAAWRPALHRPDFAASALNLAHYIALRHRDLRPLQHALMARGLSSLGRLESRVMVTLESVEAVLAALNAGAAPDPRHWPAAARRFARGSDRLHANAATLFGPHPAGRSGHILVTLGTEAAEDPGQLLALARAGMSAIRINCAHDDSAVWARMIANARDAGAAVGRRIPVLMDIAGPKIRTGEVRRPESGRLLPGDRLLLVPALGHAPEAFQAECLPPSILSRLRVGAAVALDDGRLGGEVEEIRRDGSALVRVDRSKAGGVKLKPEKGLNFPGTALGLDPLTDKDRSDLDFVAANADMIGYSFVQTADDVALLQHELSLRRPDDWRRIGIIAKIETLHGVQNLPEIIVRAAGEQDFGVMIARGDLAVEIGFTRLAEMQEEILWLCEAAAVPVIWATQVLEEMVKSGLPTRGEMTDAAMSGRAECVMLNKGPNVVAAVEVLDVLLRRMEEHQSKKTPHLRALRAW